MSSYSDLVEVVAHNMGMEKSEIRPILDKTFGFIQDNLVQGEDISTPIGKFKRADRKARMGRNPRTGEALPIAAKNGAKFTPSKALKDALG